MTFPIDDIDLAFTRKPGSGTRVEPTYSGALSFARRRYTKNLENCDLAVVGIPFDLATTARPGARFGPRAIREASAMIAWDRVHGWEFDPFESLQVIDYGDVLFDSGTPNSIPDQIEHQFQSLHSKSVKTLMLGGDHFSTFPVLKLSLIHI